MLPVITPIPNTNPDAVPSTWNTRYEEIDANFANVDGRIEALEGKEYVEVSASRTQLAADRVVFIDATAGNVTYTLLAPEDAVAITVVKVDATANEVILAAPAGKTVCGAATKKLTTADEFIRIMPHGTNWRRIG